MGEKQGKTPKGFDHIRQEVDPSSVDNFSLQEEAVFRLLEDNPRKWLYLVRDTIQEGHQIPKERMKKLLRAVAKDKTATAAQELYVFLIMQDYADETNLNILWSRILKQPRVASALLISLGKENKLSNEKIIDLLKCIYESDGATANILNFFYNSNIEFLKEIIPIFPPARSERWSNIRSTVIKELRAVGKEDIVELLKEDGKLSLVNRNLEDTQGGLAISDLDQQVTPIEELMQLEQQEADKIEESKPSGFFRRLFTRKSKN